MKLKVWFKDGNYNEFADIDDFVVLRAVPAERTESSLRKGRVVIVNQEAMSLMVVEEKPE